MTETVLKLGDLLFTAGSARGITQTLELLDNGELRRTVNGDLVDTTRVTNRKYTSSIRCSDTDAPTLGELWKGDELVVECITKLNQVVSPANDTIILNRDAVPASIIGIKSDGTKLDPTSYTAMTRTAVFAEDVVIVSYRPILTMLITDISIDTDEYDVDVGWSLSLEEA